MEEQLTLLLNGQTLRKGILDEDGVFSVRSAYNKLQRSSEEGNNSV